CMNSFSCCLLILKIEVTADDDKFSSKFGWILPHKTSSTMLPSIFNISKQHENEFIQDANDVVSSGESKLIKTKVKKASGIEIWCNILINPEVKNGRTIKLFGTIEDVDYETREKELIMFKASTDPLTGLYQKEAFYDLCRKYFKKAILEADASAALIFIDLDNFKQVNDILSHMDGDTAICDAARKLQVIFSQYDIISRFGGDEFCILVKKIPLDTLKDKLQWIIEKMRATYSRNDNTVTVTASMGIALFPKDGNNLEKLLACADNALYDAKKAGKNQFRFYEKELQKISENEIKNKSENEKSKGKK
ncbi:MAG: GGDEF domain-containing protein, partial [Treponemataceae bacterium]|nr:GGDEF domain-containing protein [Treponemataceae bacterium]